MQYISLVCFYVLYRWLCLGQYVVFKEMQVHHLPTNNVGWHNSNRNNSIIYDINPSYLSIFCRPDGTYTTYCNEAVLLVIFHSLAWDQFFWETHSGIQWRLASSCRMYQKVCNGADKTHFSIGFGWGKSEMKQEKLS